MTRGSRSRLRSAKAEKAARPPATRCQPCRVGWKGECLLRFLWLFLPFWVALPASSAEFYVRQTNWVATLLASRAALAGAADQAQAQQQSWRSVREDFPIQSDWMLQDGGTNVAPWFDARKDKADFEPRLVQKVIDELGAAGVGLRQELNRLVQSNAPAEDRRWLDLYAAACDQRRQLRLRTVLAQAPHIVFTKHHTLRPSFFAGTEGQSDAQAEPQFLPDSELCLLEMRGPYGQVRTLISDQTGAIRDPAVSWDGRRVLFAWKKLLHGDDYHLYEWDAASNTVRQITFGRGYADYEPAYLPNGDLVFASTRCVQIVDCEPAEAANLYTCDSEGRYLRRLGFDQGHALYPQVPDDGTVIYTRCEHNDRGQTFAQALFQMYPDGTGQTGFYGNISWFPTTIVHARGIPGTQKAMAILCGYHTAQAGELAIIDPARGRRENSGVQRVAPIRETPAGRADAYGQSGELWQYPYPLNEQECLVTFAPLGWNTSEPRRGDADFGIWWMDIQGRRELLAWDSRLPCSQPVALVARPLPLVWANRVDYTQTNATYYVQDIYAGPALAGVPRGAIKKLRVVALDFRAAAIGGNHSAGPGGSATVSTPVSIGNGSWEVKTVLGQATVYPDGSALFSVPARTPVYFQALDERGYAAQTMRSWSTLQPGEYFACVGCHENKNTAPPTENHGFTLAMKAGRQALEPFYGPARGFSFAKEIQPILDRHCICCHQERTGEKGGAIGAGKDLAFSLLGEPLTTDPAARRKWSDAYLALTQSAPEPAAEPAERAGFRGDCRGRLVNWISAQSAPEPLPPYFAGAARSELLALLGQGHKGTKLSREELDKIACWIDLLVPYCGDYTEANTWTPEEMQRYQHDAIKRTRMEEIEQDNIRELLSSHEPARVSAPTRLMIPGRGP